LSFAAFDVGGIGVASWVGCLALTKVGVMVSVSVYAGVLMPN
jgi:hypothetical protein